MARTAKGQATDRTESSHSSDHATPLATGTYSTQPQQSTQQMQQYQQQMYMHQMMQQQQHRMSMMGGSGSFYQQPQQQQMELQRRMSMMGGSGSFYQQPQQQQMELQRRMSMMGGSGSFYQQPQQQQMELQRRMSMMGGVASRPGAPGGYPHSQQQPIQRRPSQLHGSGNVAAARGQAPGYGLCGPGPMGFPKQRMRASSGRRPRVAAKVGENGKLQGFSFRKRPEEVLQEREKQQQQQQGEQQPLPEKQPGEDVNITVESQSAAPKGKMAPYATPAAPAEEAVAPPTADVAPAHEAPAPAPEEEAPPPQRQLSEKEWAQNQFPDVPLTTDGKDQVESTSAPVTTVVEPQQTAAYTAQQQQQMWAYHQQQQYQQWMAMRNAYPGGVGMPYQQCTWYGYPNPTLAQSASFRAPNAPYAQHSQDKRMTYPNGQSSHMAVPDRQQRQATEAHAPHASAHASNGTQKADVLATDSAILAACAAGHWVQPQGGHNPYGSMYNIDDTSPTNLNDAHATSRGGSLPGPSEVMPSFSDFAYYLPGQRQDGAGSPAMPYGSFYDALPG